MAETLPLAAIAPGELRLPDAPQAVIVIASQDDDSDDVLRDMLHEGQFATLRLDHALSSGSAGGRVRRLTDRLLGAADWIANRPQLARLPLGIFGAQEGGGAALAAAAWRPQVIRALVLRDGRPQTSGFTLDDVHAATLLIVDGLDDLSIAANQETMTHVKGIAELEILPTISAGGDDPGMQAQVARLALRWFDRFLF